MNFLSLLIGFVLAQSSLASAANSGDIKIGYINWQQAGTVKIFNGAGNFYYPGRLSWAFVGKALTATDVSNLYSVLQTFETALGRQI